MNEQLYNEWIDALESNKYKPGKEVLRTSTNEYCCLGVLCDIHDSKQWLPNLYLDEIMYTHSGYYSEIPSHIRDELNLTSNLGYFNLEDLSEELQAEIKLHPQVPTDLAGTNYTSALFIINDNTPDPFPIIAKILRERPRSLFRQ